MLIHTLSTADGADYVPRVIVDHLAGVVPYVEMLQAQDYHGGRLCLLDDGQLPGLVRILRDAGLPNAAQDLAEIIRHLPVDLIGWRRTVVMRDEATDWIFVGALSRSLPTLAVDFWITRGPLEDGVMVTHPHEALSDELSVSEAEVYRDGALIEEILTAREG